MAYNIILEIPGLEKLRFEVVVAVVPVRSGLDSMDGGNEVPDSRKVGGKD